jgi:hypothetical protein
MHPQFTYEEARRLDAFRAQHPGPPSAPRARRHLVRRLRRAARAWLRERARDDAVIDLRPLHTCIDRLPAARGRQPEVSQAVTPAGRT